MIEKAIGNFGKSHHTNSEMLSERITNHSGFCFSSISEEYQIPIIELLSIAMLRLYGHIQYTHYPRRTKSGFLSKPQSQ